MASAVRLMAVGLLMAVAGLAAQAPARVAAAPREGGILAAAGMASVTEVPQLTVTQTSYSAGSPAVGAPVTYTVSPGVSASGADENLPVSVTDTLPAGVTPVGAYGPDWSCPAPSGAVITCTDSATPFPAGSSLPPVTVEGIVTQAGVTASAIQSGTAVTATSADADQGFAGTAVAGALPPAPSGVAVSPPAGPVAGGNEVIVSGSDISAATAIEIGTAGQQQAGTPVIVLPCPAGQVPGCFTVSSGGDLDISAMPGAAGAAAVNVTVVTLGVAGSASYAYTGGPGAPAAPAAPAATAGTDSATVTWTAPASGDSPITGYVITPYLSGVVQASLSYDASSTTRTLTGLTAGTSYSFTVAAVNAAGTGPDSPQSAPVIPYTLAGAPAITSVSAGDEAATVTWTAPASDGFSAITGYVVTPFIAGIAQMSQTFRTAATTQTVTGLIPGMPYTFEVAAVNAAGVGAASAMSEPVTVNAAPGLTIAAPPAGEVGAGYRDTLTETGGTGTLTWSVSAGSLPPGLSLDPSAGVLSGTPTAAGRYDFTVGVTDDTGQSATEAVTMVIAAAPSLSGQAPPSGWAGTAYHDTLSVTGGTGPYAWAVTGGLPPGLVLHAATGVLSGTPDTVGQYAFTVKVTDSFGVSAAQDLTLKVSAGLIITTAANVSTVAQGAPVFYTITIADITASDYSGVTYSVPLAGVLDHASYDNDASATAGQVSAAAGTLTWTGDLAAGAKAVVTFSVTIHVPYTGSGTLNLTVTSPTTGANCPAGSADPRCAVSTRVAALTITETASVSSTVPGSSVVYTIAVSDAGQTRFTGATVTDDLTHVLDHATYGHDAAATSGILSFAGPLLAWTGDLEPGGTVTITYSVTVDDSVTGNVALTSTVASTATGSSCLPRIGNSLCAVSVGITAGSLSVVAPAHAVLGTVSPGGIIENSLGTVEVTDGRGVGANWVVSVSSTDLVTGSGSPAETIPAAAVGYDITGLSSTAGSTGVTHVAEASLSASPQSVVSATSASGESVVSWDPLIQVVVPPDAVAGVYTATITYSVA